jgi:hypothetical protein
MGGASPGRPTFVVQGSVYGCDSLNRAILSVPHLEKAGGERSLTRGRLSFFRSPNYLRSFKDKLAAEEGDVPCKEYEQMESMQNTERSTWAQFTYRENMHLRGGADNQEAKQLAREARARVTKIGRQMRWHREYCQECKVQS